MPVHGYPLAPRLAGSRRPSDRLPNLCRMNLPMAVVHTPGAALPVVALKVTSSLRFQVEGRPTAVA
ncbi:hypothetical protein HYPDE_33893 [Hyphomicrobium denitrificans 1NES1]|uniref:Uncharacterized protein n=1 Tax=Hyphomicrobium denitrificans 1NES1 TaxID=670307 RepID=N0BD56_9HYPH|nr:hypothetical protein HYPDE_33893 [Hyphomicrobium denitrificans 1NES1]